MNGEDKRVGSMFYIGKKYYYNIIIHLAIYYIAVSAAMICRPCFYAVIVNK